MDRNIAHGLGLAAVKSKNRETLHSHDPRLFEGAQDIPRIPAAGESDQNITPASVYRQLGRKNLVIAFVVGETADYGGIGWKRVHANAQSLLLRPRVQKIIGQVYGVARATTVACEE